jgi:serine/threonine protein kinase
MDDIQQKILKLEQLVRGQIWDGDISKAAIELADELETRLPESDPRLKEWNKVIEQRNQARSAARMAQLSTATPGQPASNGAPAKLGPFEQALRAVTAAQSLQALKRLQSGQFSTGFAAADAASGRQVVLKLPAEEAWDLRFDECAQAIQTEAALLRAIAPLLQGSSEPCAQPVEPLARGEVQVEDWRAPVPWATQSFAQGERVSTLLPLRDDQEPAALRILLQVVGMVRQLYAHGYAHRDLKPDCLFWDSAAQRLEVIDWNRATSDPSEDDQSRELAALQRLAGALLLGPTFRWSAADSYRDDLLLAFQGRPLSRGTRLMLLRLFDPSHPQPIRQVDEWSTVLKRLVALWEQPLRERPTPDGATLQTLSHTLDHLSVELQRGEVERVPVASDWMVELLRPVQLNVQQRVRIWLADREALRSSLRQIEEPWQWFPDLWPLGWLVPLCRAWFQQFPRERNSALAELAAQLAAGQWEQIEAQTEQLSSLPAPLGLQIQRLREAARAYRLLEQAEQQLQSATPNYALVLEQLRTLRQTLPSEPRVWRLERLTSLGAERAETIVQLWDRIAELSGQPPTSDRQHRIYAELLKLHRLDVADPRLASQKQVIDLIDRAKQALAVAEAEPLPQRADIAIKHLSPWLNHAELEQAAADLAEQIRACWETASRSLVGQQLASVLRDLREAASAGDFAQAAQSLQEARQIVGREGARLPATAAARLDQMEDGLAQIRALWEALGQTPVRQARPLELADLPPLLQPLAWALNRLAAQHQQLQQSDQDLTSLLRACDQLRPVAASPEISGVVPLQRALQADVSGAIRQRLRDLLQQPGPLSQEQLALAEAALAELRSASQSDLAPLEQLCQRHRDAQTLTLVQAEIGRLETRLKDEAALQRDEQVALKKELLAGMANLAAQGPGRELGSAIQQVEQQLKEQLGELQKLVERQINHQHILQNQVIGWQQALGQTTGTSQPPVSQDTTNATQPPDLAGADTDPVEEATQLRGLEGADVGPVLTLWGALRRATVSLWALGLIVLVGVALGITSLVLGRSLLMAPTIAPTADAQTALPLPTDQPPPTAPSTAVSEQRRSVAAVAATALITTVAIPALAPTVQVEPAVASLSQTVTLSRPGLGPARQITVQGITRPITPTVASPDRWQLLLPEDLLASSDASLTLPQPLHLDLGNGITATLQLSQTVLTVRGFGQAAQDERFSYQGEAGAYLWSTPDGKNTNIDIVRLPDKPNEYVLLTDGDQVLILGCQGERYRVRVLSNALDKEKANGLEGWIRKAIVHGR